MLSLFFFEAVPLKRQLALMQCLIKGVSMLTDLDLGLGGSAVIADSAGTPYVPACCCWMLLVLAPAELAMQW